LIRIRVPIAFVSLGSLLLGFLQRTLMLTNGCFGSSQPSQCMAVSNGLFLKGLHAVVQYYAASIMDVLVFRMSRPTVTSPDVFINDTRWQDAESISYHMLDALRTASVLRRSTVEKYGADYASNMNALQAVFVVGVVATYVLVYSRLMRSLNRELRNAKATLAMVPEDIANAVPGIRNLIRTYATQSAKI
jgi:hypothetical protein